MYIDISISSVICEPKKIKYVKVKTYVQTGNEKNKEWKKMQFEAIKSEKMTVFLQRKLSELGLWYQNNISWQPIDLTDILTDRYADQIFDKNI